MQKNYKFYGRSKEKKYPIYIGKERIKRLYDNINNGKIVI